MVDTVIVALAGCAASVLAYLLGWHRGIAAYPMFRSRPKPPAPKPTPEEVEAKAREKREEEIEAKRDVIRGDLKRKYPHLMPQELDAATKEVLEKARQTMVAR